jgi:hypothetical protein
MSVQVYGCNHVALEVDGVEKAVAFQTRGGALALFTAS